MTIDPQITHTFLGQEYHWDRVSDADPALLRTNREASMNVLTNPSKYPHADFTRIARHVIAIDEFFAEHAALLEKFA